MPEGRHLTFSDLIAPWHKYLAFLLSFVNIAGFWRRHHDFFLYIRKLDERILFINICWLFCVVVLPFSTSLLSYHFGDTPAVFLYSLNIFFIAIAQNFIWDYADGKPDFIDPNVLGDERRKDFRRMLNLDMLNGAIAIVVSFFMPKLAFYLLFFKIPLFVIVAFIIARKRRAEVKEMKKEAP